jgi:hypothetical protein
MRIKLKGLTPAEFDRWAAGMRGGSGQLTRAEYSALAQPSSYEPVRRYASVDPTLFLDIVNQCAEPGQACKDACRRIRWPPVPRSSPRPATRRCAHPTSVRQP